MRHRLAKVTAFSWNHRAFTPVRHSIKSEDIDLILHQHLAFTAGSTDKPFMHNPTTHLGTSLDTKIPEVSSRAHYCALINASMNKLA